MAIAVSFERKRTEQASEERKRGYNSRSGLLVLERLERNSLDAHDV